MCRPYGTGRLERQWDSCVRWRGGAAWGSRAEFRAERGGRQQAVEVRDVLWGDRNAEEKSIVCPGLGA